jgi:hypothetical protein
MSFSQKLVIILATVSASALGLTSVAFAGEGGAAGSAAFTIGAEGQVTGVAVAAGIGKQDAFAGAFNTSAGNNAAFAMGSAGVISISTLNSTEISSISSQKDESISTAQNNSFTTNTSVQIGTKSSDQVVLIKPQP